MFYHALACSFDDLDLEKSQEMSLDLEQRMRDAETERRDLAEAQRAAEEAQRAAEAAATMEREERERKVSSYGHLKTGDHYLGAMFCAL